MDIKREEAFNEVIDKLYLYYFLYYVSKVRIAGIRQDIKKILC